MEKRKIIFGTYDTAATGLWTLMSWSLSPAVFQQNIVEVPGRRRGPLDLSTALTDGEPIYGPRTLTAVLESSEGTRLERKARIDTMINWLDGWNQQIVLPDDPSRYITGRVSVAENYNDDAHAAVTVTAICEPWRYSAAETEIALTAATEAQTVDLVNSGRMTVLPLLVITGTAANVLLEFGASSWALGPGSYQLPDLILPQGSSALIYSGTGTVQLTYREAVL